MLNDGGRFVLYLGQAVAARRLTELGSLTDCAADPLDESIPLLTVELEDMPRFIEEVTVGHTVALIDVCLPTRKMAARHVAFAYFPRKCILVSNAPVYEDDLVVLMPRKEKAAPVAESDDFWG